MKSGFIRALLALMYLLTSAYGNVSAEENPFEERAKQSAREQQTFEERIAAFKADPQGMLLYVEGGSVNFLIAIYRDGRLEYVGTPRLRSLPERFDVYRHEMPMSRIRDLETEFAKRHFFDLDYIGIQGVRPFGLTLTYKNLSGISKTLSTGGGKRPPPELYELIEQLFIHVDLKSFTCSEVGKSNCVGYYRSPKYGFH